MSKTIECEILKQYKLIRKMGSGAYGHVFEVKDVKSNKTYALKKVFDAFRNSIDAQRTYR
jgi:mitogen-activated protein kinase 15